MAKFRITNSLQEGNSASGDCLRRKTIAESVFAPVQLCSGNFSDSSAMRIE
jgi:hypothetical protein